MNTPPVRLTAQATALAWLVVSSVHAHAQGLWSGVTDNDYDGRSDAQEVADGTDPKHPGSFKPVRLGYWRFNGGDGVSPWRSELGQMPVGETSLRTAPSFDGEALDATATNEFRPLLYRETESNGNANFNARSGSIRLLYKPDWSSRDGGAPMGFTWGGGPGEWARLIELGRRDAAEPFGYFGISIDPDGTNLVIEVRDAKGQLAVPLKRRISFVHGQPGWSVGGGPVMAKPQWHEIVVAWSPAGLQTHVDGVKGIEAAGLAFKPSAFAREAGLAIGSDHAGRFPARGLIDELEVMNFPLGEAENASRLLIMQASARPGQAMLELNWRSDPNYPPALRRRELGSTNWTWLATNLTAFRFTDTNVLRGQAYEYEVERRVMRAGVDLPPTERRGRILLAVDQTIAREVSAELKQLTEDLVGDGWLVSRREVERHDDVNWSVNPERIARVKALLRDEFIRTRDDPVRRLRAVWLIGHVPVPYSGATPDDGHFRPGEDHRGAWPADAYYGVFDGQWTDATVNLPASVFRENRNVPGDGKFDQDRLPQPPEFALARLDFWRLPAFETNNPAAPLGEVNLLRRYFQKDHRYRHKQLPVPRTAIVGGYTGGWADTDIFANAGLNVSRWYGTRPGVWRNGDFFSDRQPCLWGFLAGYGNPQGVFGKSGGHHTSAKLEQAETEPQAAFLSLIGSWFGDWNMTNNLLRATLGGRNYGLAAMWCSTRIWRFEGLALGECLADGYLRTVNDTNQFRQGVPRSLALLGDPTLRSELLAPPRQLQTERVTGGSVRLTWQPAEESGACYLVYRAASAEGPFTRVTAEPLEQTQFSEAAPRGGNVYQVRTVKLIYTGSGSFTNLSQGVFANFTSTGADKKRSDAATRKQKRARRKSSVP